MSTFEQITVDELLNLAKSDEFPKKYIQIGDKKKYFTPVLHFYLHDQKFRTKPNHPIKFKCKICDIQLQAKIGDASNLN